MIYAALAFAAIHVIVRFYTLFCERQEPMGRMADAILIVWAAVTFYVVWQVMP